MKLKSLVVLAILLFAVLSHAKEPCLRIYLYDRDGKQVSEANGFFVARNQLLTLSRFLKGADSAKVGVGGRRFSITKIIGEDGEKGILKVLTAGEGDLPVFDLAKGDEISLGEGLSVDGLACKVVATGDSIVAAEGAFEPDAKLTGVPALNEHNEIAGIVGHVDQAKKIAYIESVNGLKFESCNLNVSDWNRKKDKEYRESPDVLFHGALLKRAQGKYEEAIALLKKALEKKKGPTGYFELGLCYAKIGKNAEAAKAFEDSVKISPSADAFFNLGIVYFNQNSYHKAVGAFKETVKLQPANAKAHYNLGIASLALGDLDSAKAELKALEKLDKNFHEKLKKLIIDQ